MGQIILKTKQKSLVGGHPWHPDPQVRNRQPCRCLLSSSPDDSKGGFSSRFQHGEERQELKCEGLWA